MGFARRVVRKTVRKATPRTVRKAMHPVRTAKNAVTPRPVKQMSRALYTVTNPLGAAENALIGSVLNAGSGRSRTSSRGANAPRAQTSSRSDGDVFVGTGVRADAALESANNIASLMAVQRERFSPAAKPIVPDPAAPDPGPLAAAAWNQMGKQRPSLWKRAQRREVCAQLAAEAAARAFTMHEAALAQAAEHRATAETWWNDLVRGEPEVLAAALTRAFSDNVAAVNVKEAEGTAATLLLLLPGIEVLGTKQAHITPSGRLSSRNWPKADLHDAYASLLGAHLLATAREAWAVGPSLRTLRVLGLRRTDSQDTVVLGGFEVMFDVDLERDNADWTSNELGELLLEEQACGLRRVGKTEAVTPWLLKDLPARTTSTILGHD